MLQSSVVASHGDLDRYRAAGGGLEPRGTRSTSFAPTIRAMSWSRSIATTGPAAIRRTTCARSAVRGWATRASTPSGRRRKCAALMAKRGRPNKRIRVLQAEPGCRGVRAGGIAPGPDPKACGSLGRSDGASRPIDRGTRSLVSRRLGRLSGAEQARTLDQALQPRHSLLDSPDARIQRAQPAPQPQRHRDIDRGPRPRPPPGSRSTRRSRIQCSNRDNPLERSVPAP